MTTNKLPFHLLPIPAIPPAFGVRQDRDRKYPLFSLFPLIRIFPCGNIFPPADIDPDAINNAFTLAWINHSLLN